MGLEDLLKFAFHAAKEHPRILLPGVINWIPIMAFLIVAAFTLSDFSMVALVQSLSTVEGIIALVTQLGVALVGLMLLFWITSALVQAMYIDLTRQFAQHKKPSIAAAYYAARKVLVPLMWTQALVLVILAVAVGALMLVMFINPIVGIFVMFVGIFYVVVKLWMVPVAVVLENRRGLDALKRGAELSKGYFWHIWLVLLVIGFVNNVVTSAVLEVPYLGFTLFLLAFLFFGFWAASAPPAFYFEYLRKKRKR